MAPIHDTDLGEERWARTEWQRFELWEKIEVRLKKRKILWILAAVFVFLILSSVPIVMDQLPRWRGQSAARKLAQQINWLKKQVSLDHQAYRLRFVQPERMEFVIEKLSSCKSEDAQQVYTSRLSDKGHTAVLTTEQATKIGIPGIVTELCYDPLLGSDQSLKLGSEETPIGFGFMSVNDLSEGRNDRLSILLVHGSSAELTLE